MIDKKNIYPIEELYVKKEDIVYNYGLLLYPELKLKDAKTNNDIFRKLFWVYGYGCLRNFIIPEFHDITREELSPWWVWFLETYCNSNDGPIPFLIMYHRMVMCGEYVSEDKWQSVGMERKGYYMHRDIAQAARLPNGYYNPRIAIKYALLNEEQKNGAIDKLYEQITYKNADNQ